VSHIQLLSQKDKTIALKIILYSWSSTVKKTTQHNKQHSLKQRLKVSKSCIICKSQHDYFGKQKQIPKEEMEPQVPPAAVSLTVQAALPSLLVSEQWDLLR
jgi:hypothetical protein